MDNSVGKYGCVVETTTQLLYYLQHLTDTAPEEGVEISKKRCIIAHKRSPPSD